MVSVVGGFWGGGGGRTWRRGALSEGLNVPGVDLIREITEPDSGPLISTVRTGDKVPFPFLRFGEFGQDFDTVSCDVRVLKSMHSSRF